MGRRSRVDCERAIHSISVVLSATLIGVLKTKGQGRRQKL